MRKQVQTNRSLWLVLGITIFVGVLLVIVLLAQRSFSHQIKQVELTLSTGPVSTEYQQTVKVVITKQSCQVTSMKYQTPPKTESCPMDEQVFNKIQASIGTYGIIDKIIANSDEANLIGGKQSTLQIELQDGTKFMTNLNSEFLSSKGPFFDEIQLLVPATEQTIPSQ